MLHPALSLDEKTLGLFGVLMDTFWGIFAFLWGEPSP